MSKLKKLNAFFITLIFSHSATAVILEGSLSGKTTIIYSSSMQDVLDSNAGANNVAHSAEYLASALQVNPSSDSNLFQESSILPAQDVHDNVVGYAGMEASGIANRAEYHGWRVDEVTSVEVQAEEVVTVPEPSPLLLLFGPFLFLLWRMGVLTKLRR